MDCPSFELGISDLKPALAFKGVTGYSSNVYFKGSSVFYGMQAGVSYKVNDMISVYGGGRYVYAVNTYQGHLKQQYRLFWHYAMSASSFYTTAATKAAGGVASVQPLIDEGAGGYTLAQAESNNVINI